MAELKVEIGADVKQLISALNETEKRVRNTSNNLTDLALKNTRVQNSIDKLSASYKSGAISEEQYGRSLSRLEKLQDSYTKELKDTRSQLTSLNSQYNSLKSGLGGAEKGVSKLGKSTANANPTLQEFSRVIQDAPYGIQGVGNNITQLVSQFGYLQKSTGGTKNALKALAGSFLGPGGVLFLISTAVSLLTVYGDELLSAGKKTDKFADASRDAAAGVQGEIASMNALVAVARDENQTRQKRLDAVKVLNKNYPELNNNIKLETINTNATTRAIEAATTALEKRAKIRAAEGLIAKEAEKLFKKQIELEEQKEDAINQSIQSQLQGQKSYSRGLGALAIDSEKVRVAAEKRIGKEFAKRLEESSKDYEDYIKRLNTLISGSDNLLDIFGGGNDKVKDLKKEAAKYKEFLKTLDADLKLLDAEDEAQNAREIEGIYRQSGAALAADAKEREGLISLTKSVQEVEDFQEKLNEVRKILNDDQFNFDSVLSNDQVDAFIDRLERAKQGATLFGDAVGNSIGQIGNQISGQLETGNAVIDAFVGTLVNGIAQIAASALQGLIVNKALSKITQGVEFAKSSANGITIATSAAAALGPGGIVALPGLLAGVQATIAGAFAGINSFALGSGGFSGDKNLAMVNRNEMILRPMEQSALYGAIRGHRLGSINQSVQSSGMSSPQVEFRLEGTDIVGSVKNTMRRNTRTGGSLTL